MVEIQNLGAGCLIKDSFRGLLGSVDSCENVKEQHCGHNVHPLHEHMRLFSGGEHGRACARI